MKRSTIELLISEFSSVLSKGGVLILSTPFFFYLHEAPNDFYRFSKYSLKGGWHTLN